MYKYTPVHILKCSHSKKQSSTIVLLLCNTPEVIKVCLAIQICMKYYGATVILGQIKPVRAVVLIDMDVQCIRDFSDLNHSY